MAKEVWRPGNMLYPAPPVMVSCQRPGEKPNIITVAWAGTICSDPVMLSISVRKERHSHSIIKDTGEFVVNLTSKKLAFAADWCGVRSGREYDKFKEMKLTPLPSQKISAPGIEEAPVNIECKVKQILELGSHDMFIAEVVSVSVDEKLMDDKGRLDLGKAGLVAYSHGEYFMLGEKLGKFGYSVARKPLDKEKSKPAGKKASKDKSWKDNKSKDKSGKKKNRKEK
ncbi:flavin reductase family protein [Butyrivibrio sp. VCB2006]|uniref:flavin reductase family protein n=1 Tax=Butyrivibrio sp. VCB2006 TaxID=1280679 RepID=UPI00041D4D89|nr:flavin reductase family protein [Butyrivibrio sp. VCB2006]